MFDQVAVSEAGCVFIVPPYVSVGREDEIARARSSEATRAAQLQWSTVWVVDQPVQGSREQPRAASKDGFWSSPQVPSRPVAPASSLVPIVEARRRGRHHVEELHWIDQVAVFARSPTQVFTGQLEAQVAGKDARSVTKAGRVARRTRVSGLIDHRATQLGIVSP